MPDPSCAQQDMCTPQPGCAPIPQPGCQMPGGCMPQYQPGCSPLPPMCMGAMMPPMMPMPPPPPPCPAPGSVSPQELDQSKCGSEPPKPPQFQGPDSFIISCPVPPCMLQQMQQQACGQAGAPPCSKQQPQQQQRQGKPACPSGCRKSCSPKCHRRCCRKKSHKSKGHSKQRKQH